MTGREIRATISEIFRGTGACCGPQFGDSPQERSDPDVHQCRHEPVQGLFPGLEDRDTTGQPAPRSACGLAASTTTWRNVGRTARHIPSSRCWATSPSATISRKKRFAFAWEFLTVDLKLDKSRLYVTVYTDDDEAADLWHLQEGVPRERIYHFGEKDNFWSHGRHRPCGPCTEIFWDNGPEVGCGSPDVPWGATVTATWRSGTMSSCSSTALPTEL